MKLRLLLIMSLIMTSTFFAASKVVKKYVMPSMRTSVEHFQSFNWTEIQRSAILSSFAYKDPVYVCERLATDTQSKYGPKTYNCVKNLCEVIVAEKNPLFFDGSPLQHAQAYFWLNRLERKAYVAFRGTESTNDIIADIDARHTNVQGLPIDVKVHMGFYKQLASIQHSIQDTLDTYKDDYDDIVFCGHSLGGALATLGTVIVAKPNDKNVTCITFGAPRSGNKEFAATFDKIVAPNSWRVFNENDPVPMVPASFRFEHVGHGICIDDNSKLSVCRRDIPWALRPFVMTNEIDLPNLIGDHDCGLYIKRIERFILSTS